MTRHLGTLGSIARVKYITPLHLYAAILPLPSQLVFERRNATGELPQFAAELRDFGLVRLNGFAYGRIRA